MSAHRTPAAGPLGGLVVVDLSHHPAGWRASGLLADYGADVVWVEPPGGCPARQRFPIECAVFNRGKRSITLDARRDAHLLARLLQRADVVIQCPADEFSDLLAFAADGVTPDLPSLVRCTITGFGTNGPLRDLPAEEAIVHAVVGTMGEQLGHRDGPIFEGLPFASIGAGHLAVIGILAALYRRNDDGLGRRVETSLLDGALAYLSLFWGESDAASPVKAAVVGDSSLVARSTRLVTGSFRCADDEYIGVHTGAVGGFGRLMEVLGLDERIRPSESGLDMGLLLTPEEKALLYTEIHKIFATLPRGEWVEKLRKADVCGVPQLHPGEVFDEAQARFNEMVVTVDDPSLGLIEQVAPAIKFPSFPMVAPRPSPVPGADTDGVLADPPARSRRWCGDGAPDERPLLDGVKILDLGAYFAGPFASRLLADLGADVIKLEPVAGDPLRGADALFRAAQAGKRSVAIDLKAAQAQPGIRALVGWADVVHHNMRPGAAERLGVGRADVRALNPAAIYGYAPGWGSEGPFADRQSFEPMMSGFVGAGFEVAGQYNPPLYPLGNADPGNGLVGAVAMLMALLHRADRGDALEFEHPQLNATMGHVAHIVRKLDGEVLGAGKLDVLQYGIGPLERLYETSDGWICLVAPEDADVARLGNAIGIELLGDARFVTPELRAENEYELSNVVGTALQAYDTAGAVDILCSAGVAVAEPVPYNNTAFMRDPDNRRTGRVAELPHARLGNVRELAHFLRVSNAEVSAHRLAPELGSDTRCVLLGLGCDVDTLEKLQRTGAIRQAEHEQSAELRSSGPPQAAPHLSARQLG